MHSSGNVRHTNKKLQQRMIKTNQAHLTSQRDLSSAQNSKMKHILFYNCVLLYHLQRHAYDRAIIMIKTEIHN